jgi:hypothetical protein
MDGAMPHPWKALAEFDKREQNRLRFALRDAVRNGLLDDGVVAKFGRLWFVNTDRLPDWAIKRTREILQGHGPDSPPPQHRRRGNAPIEAD